ncbi:unnamed protein product [Ambrosiozyma monospora]|uniref:Unnamed protein product n=1 Tax=Ambrosiozyma monospora TaxID=43982 RepID=A0A9W6TA45_AMBMO|nr:unnamed protein product [Ambrosiozyma monospora]
MKQFCTWSDWGNWNWGGDNTTVFVGGGNTWDGAGNGFTVLVGSSERTVGDWSNWNSGLRDWSTWNSGFFTTWRTWGTAWN